jgi:hypothetical protein
VAFVPFVPFVVQKHTPSCRCAVVVRKSTLDGAENGRPPLK